MRAEIVYLQMADAANVVAELRRHPAFGLRLPLREVVLALACILLLASLYFLRGVGGGIPDLSAAGVPPFTPAASRPRTDDQVPNPAVLPPGSEQAPTTAEVQERAARSNEAQRDLSTLGQALDNHSVTSQAADAIARGDYDAAADELRDLAANASDLEPETREALADDLDAAADQMSEGSEELAQASRDAADGLRQGGEPAQQGLDNLGDEVQETGEEVVSQQELADQMAAAQAAESNGTQSQSGEQGESGEQQSGEAGAEGDNRRPPSGQQAGSPGEGEPGEPGSEGSEGQQGQPGATQPQDAADRGNNPGRNQNQGQGEQRGRSSRSASQPGQPGMPQPGEGQPGDPGSPADSQGQPGEGQQEGGDPQAGAGAGSGETQDAAGEQQGAQAGEEQAPGEGLPAEERVNTAEQPEGGEPTGDPRAADDAIQLDRTGGQGIQTGNDSGSASAGSGTGVMTASGDASQEEVGEAGPDSNHVPPGYEGIVTDYFSDPEQDG